MHLLLTDRLTCPRCGPAFGLILRADELEERRVRRGGLGCPNCREVYPVEAGVGDLRPPPREPGYAPMALPEPDDQELLRAQALLGVTDGPGEVLILGRATRFGPGLASRLPEAEVVGAASQVPEWPEGPGLSRMLVGARLPFAGRSLRGVLLEGDVPPGLLREAARTLAPDHRVVVLDAPEDAPAGLMAAGLTLKLNQDGVVVAGR